MTLSNYLQFGTYLLDWDGCIGMTLQNWLITYRETYQKYNVYTNDAEILNHSWGNLQEGPRHFGLDPEKTWTEIVEKVAERNKTVTLYPNAFETMIELKRLKKKIAIVTSSETKIVKPAIEFNQLAQYIDGIFTEEMVSKPKPDPEIVLLAINSLGGTIERSVIIGDTSKDIQAGKAAGIKTMLVQHTENEIYYDSQKMKLSNPDYVINGF